MWAKGQQSKSTVNTQYLKMNIRSFRLVDIFQLFKFKKIKLSMTTWFPKTKINHYPKKGF